MIPRSNKFDDGELGDEVFNRVSHGVTGLERGSLDRKPNCEKRANRSQGLAGVQRPRRTTQVRLTRSIFIDGRHAEKGSTLHLAQPLADDLIAQASAVRLNAVSRFFAWIRLFFVDSDAEVGALMTEQLVNYLPEIRSIAAKRAAAALGKKFVGRQLCSKEHGKGTLVETTVAFLKGRFRLPLKRRACC